MPFYGHERFQVFCRFCQGKMEADSEEAVMRLVEAHEAVCPKRKAAPK